MLPLIELAVLCVIVAAPFALNGRPDLITLFTNIIILSLLAISFDLCWGFSGILSFGQALFFGVPGYVIALVGRDLGISQIWLTIPLAMLTGLLLAFVVALFLLVGRRPTPIFVALGTLTGSYAAERLVSGWQYVGAGVGYVRLEASPDPVRVRAAYVTDADIIAMADAIGYLPGGGL